jgi:hypothetical protein
LESSSLFFHTSINLTQKKRRLLIGSSIAGAGALCLILPLAFPAISFYLFVLGITFIAAGLIPYKRIIRFETFPITLKCTENAISLRQGSKSLVIHYAHIMSIFYDTKKRCIIIKLRYTLTPEPLKTAPWKRYYSLKTLCLTLPQFTESTYKAVLEVFKMERQVRKPEQDLR